jgi:ketosteroid isomerase-like protein
MSETNPNIALVYESLAAYQRGDEGRVRQLMDPSIEVYGAPNIVNSGTYRGFEGYRRWLNEWEEAWDEASYGLGEIVEVDENVLVVPVHIVGRGTGSGIEIDSVFGWLYQFRDGRAIRFQVHATPDEALEAARGLAAHKT